MPKTANGLNYSLIPFQAHTVLPESTAASKTSFIMVYNESFSTYII